MPLSRPLPVWKGSSSAARFSRAKTAAMFGAAAAVGAQVANCRPATVATFQAFGMALGTAFQLADDALDYDGTECDTGKGVGDDFNEGKATMPALLAYRAGDLEARSFWKRTIMEGDRREGDLAHALRLARQSGATQETRRLATEHAAEARAAILAVPPTPYRNALSELADYAVRRRS